jgi:hypothetical protein
MSSIPVVQRVVAILWPSFIVAGIATVLFTTAFDPAEMTIFADYGISRLGSYTICFFLYCFFGAVTSTATCYFLKPCATVNKTGSQDKSDSVNE